jgi:hypothetical protein
MPLTSSIIPFAANAAPFSPPGFSENGGQRAKRTLRRWSSILMIAAGIMVAATSAFSRDKTPVPRYNVILIGWDGADRGHVFNMLNRGKLPNLQRLVRKGALIPVDVLGATDTKAGWAEILTGCGPAITNVYSNTNYRPMPEGVTIFDRVKQYFGPTAYKKAAIIAKEGCVLAGYPLRFPVFSTADSTGALYDETMPGRLVVENGLKYRILPGIPDENACRSIDIFAQALNDDERTATMTLALLEKHGSRPFFFFVLFDEIDKKGHGYGENSKEYRNAFLSADYQTGRIMKKLKEMKLDKKTLVYVVADHGFDKRAQTHHNAPNVFLASNDPKIGAPGTRADITPTILDAMGVRSAAFVPAFTGTSLHAMKKTDAEKRLAFFLKIFKKRKYG